MNRLSVETSPYLRQHAENPVHWWPWCEEALERARKERKMILLSVGYSTCHWCHVMERESFEDEDIARVLNAHYIPIKVDREERPDIDAVYMLATQVISGQGGWPMTVWLTPALDPIFAGTYFPARDGDRGVRYGFLTLLEQIALSFQENREQMEGGAEDLTRKLQAHFVTAKTENVPGEEVIQQALGLISERFDLENGGISGAPKFPSSLPMQLLLTSKNHQKHVLFTLEKICLSGTCDQVEGGFHRYAVDEKWSVPHFEKMLYDNALLLELLHFANQIKPDDLFQRKAEATKQFLLGQLRAESGLFYAAMDADSKNDDGESEEGFYYTLDETELADEPVVQVEGSRYTVHGAELSETQKKRLLSLRAKKEKPFTDKKLLCSWNSLALSALCFTGLEEAKKVADALIKEFWRDGQLFRTGQIEAQLEDYAYLIKALLDFANCSGDSSFIGLAEDILKLADKKLLSDTGAYYSASVISTSPPLREISCLDNALPSPNAVMAMNLLRLYAFTEQVSCKEKAEAIFKCFGEELSRYPQACGSLLFALNGYHKEIARVKVSTDEERREVMEAYTPYVVVTSAEETSVCKDNHCLNIDQGLTRCLQSLL